MGQSISGEEPETPGFQNWMPEVNCLVLHSQAIFGGKDRTEVMRATPDFQLSFP